MTEGLEALPERAQAIERKLDALSSSVDRRFESVDRRFDDVDRRLEEANQHFVEQRQYTEFAYGRLERRMAAGFRIEAKLDHVISRNLGDRRRVHSNPPRAASRSRKRSRRRGK
jgi:hypothetical protein